MRSFYWDDPKKPILPFIYVLTGPFDGLSNSLHAVAINSTTNREVENISFLEVNG